MTTDVLTEALVAGRVVLSVMGPHAGEDAATIFSRKMADIARCGRTLWLCRSPPARPDRAQAFFEAARGFVLFLAPASKNGARATTEAARATETSPDGAHWRTIDPLIGPVTGRLTKGAYAFALSRLVVAPSDARVDLWEYADGNAPVRFRLGASTLLAQRASTAAHAGRALSRFRQIIAIAETTAPHAMWVR